MHAQDGRKRVVIEVIKPEIDAGRFPLKRIVGDRVQVEADIFVDGHDALSALLLYRHVSEAAWTELALEPLANDRWQGSFDLPRLGAYLYTIRAGVDPFRSWRRDLLKKAQAGQDVAVDLMAGAALIEQTLGRAPEPARLRLERWLSELRAEQLSQAERVLLAMDEELAALMSLYADLALATTYEKELGITVDCERARFSAWYEMFPRSAAAEPGRHGTFRDCIARLPEIAQMGFNVLYLPPIHPIGRARRKGRNNSVQASPEDPGSPWAIGAAEGGHKALHPQLGTLADFHELLARAREHGLELALDIAFQTAPDHPLVQAHPEWFRWRPDGTVQYAENPPKKYEDIFPFNFETPHWAELWEELKSIFLYWIGQGVRIFRVDNPHTKPFRFWEYVLGEIKKDYPEVLFLAEAFTRPKVMFRLAKLGFSQSYTYFAWRNTKWELTKYFTELAASGALDYFRPSLWPNTPDILTEYLQTGGRAAFAARLVLAATLGANYGIYGPAFELCENRPKQWGSEEYLDSEKYEIRHWELQRPDSLAPLIGRVNRIRRENPALQRDGNLAFHPVDNEQLICYSKQDEAGLNFVLVVVNLDPHHTQSGWVELRAELVQFDPAQPYQVHDLLSDERYLWHGTRNYVQLNPQLMPAAIFLLRRRLRSERDFEYFM